jgi:hypothetical protein
MPIKPVARLVLRSADMPSVTDLRNAQPAQARVMQRDRAAAVSFRAVSKSFPAADGSRLEVLRAVSFDVSVGEIVANWARPAPASRRFSTWPPGCFCRTAGGSP